MALLTLNKFQLKSQITSQTAAVTELNNIINSYKTEIIFLLKLKKQETQDSNV